MQVNAAAVCAFGALVMCFGSFLPVRVEAEPVEQEPIVKVNPYSATESPRTEDQEVIDVLRAMGKAYASGDIPGYIKHLDEHCSVFDEGQNRMVEGKEAVVVALKQKFAQRSQTGSDHIVSYTIDQPYVKVTGETAVVTYSVIEKVSGQHERTLKGLMSDVFKKKTDTG